MLCEIVEAFCGSKVEMHIPCLFLRVVPVFLIKQALNNTPVRYYRTHAVQTANEDSHYVLQLRGTYTHHFISYSPAEHGHLLNPAAIDVCHSLRVPEEWHAPHFQALL